MSFGSPPLYSYNFPVMRKVNKDLLDKADLLIIQINNFGKEKTSINDNILEQYGDYSEKLLWHKYRESFAKNITPIMFLKKQEERSNFKYNSIMNECFSWGWNLLEFF